MAAELTLCNGYKSLVAEVEKDDCDSGDEMSPVQVCDWKSYGLFGTLGKGVYVFVTDVTRGQAVFMSIAWEPSALVAPA